jgi:hypothetical protein
MLSQSKLEISLLLAVCPNSLTLSLSKLKILCLLLFAQSASRSACQNADSLTSCCLFTQTGVIILIQRDAARVLTSASTPGSHNFRVVRAADIQRKLLAKNMVTTDMNRNQVRGRGIDKWGGSFQVTGLRT